MSRAAHVRIDHTARDPKPSPRHQIDSDFVLHPNPPEAERKARLTVVWLAEDADDARDLLDKLGLL
jgi:hypothetical protein